MMIKLFPEKMQAWLAWLVTLTECRCCPSLREAPVGTTAARPRSRCLLHPHPRAVRLTRVFVRARLCPCARPRFQVRTRRSTVTQFPRRHDAQNSSASENHDLIKQKIDSIIMTRIIDIDGIILEPRIILRGYSMVIDVLGIILLTSMRLHRFSCCRHHYYV